MKNHSPEKGQAAFQDFLNLDIRIGTVLTAEPFTQAKQAAYRLLIDFGEIGKLKSSAQITERYSCEQLIGKQVVAVVNFPPKQIADMMSACLVLGALGEDGVTLLTCDTPLPNGIRIA